MADATAASSTSNSSASNCCADADLDLANLFDPSADGDKGNSLSVYCPRCPSLILRPGSGSYVNVGSWPLPDMQVQLNNKNRPNGHVDVSSYQHFWSVDDVFTFENVGYTKTVDGRYKYLTCADCECGPLGVQVIGDEETAMARGLKKNFSYLALARVNHHR